MMEKIGLAAFVLLVLFMVALTFVSVRDTAICLEHGWALTRTTWKLESFCIREENEYEIVKSVIEVVNE